MFLLPVVVCGDRPRANVGTRADLCITDVREVSHLNTLLQRGILYLAEVAHVHMTL